MFGAACAWKAYWVLSTEWILPANQWHWLVGNKISLAPAIPRGKQREKNNSITKRAFDVWYVKRENVSQQYISFLALSGTLLQNLSIFWHEKNVFPFVLVFRSLQTEWERFPSISSLGWSVGKQYLQSKYLSRLNQSRKTGHTWAVFNGCWVNIISYIGCSKELENHWKHLSRL